MKKFIFLSLIAAGIISCEKEGLDPIGQGTPIELVDQKTINSYKSWEEFYQVYSEYSEISDLTELEANSLYEIDKDDRKYSPALQGIINENNQFKVGNDIIELDNGVFKKINYKSNIKEFENIGTVNVMTTPLDDSAQIVPNEKSSPLSPYNSSLYETREFRQVRYVNCQNGVDHGSAPRSFRFLHQVYSEFIVLGSRQVYSLYLRLFLEYNHRRGSWRLSGENREISVDIKDSSILGGEQGVFSSGTKEVKFNSSCTSHRGFLLKRFNTTIPLGSPSRWFVSLSGTITEKMTGNNYSWNHVIDY